MKTYIVTIKFNNHPRLKEMTRIIEADNFDHVNHIVHTDKLTRSQGEIVSIQEREHYCSITGTNKVNVPTKYHQPEDDSEPAPTLNHDALRSQLDHIARRYDHEHDFNPDVPVSFGTIQLIWITQKLLDEIEYLRNAHDALASLFFFHTSDKEDKSND